jgi:hypothetical protein
MQIGLRSLQYWFQICERIPEVIKYRRIKKSQKIKNEINSVLWANLLNGFFISEVPFRKKDSQTRSYPTGEDTIECNRIVGSVLLFYGTNDETFIIRKPVKCYFEPRNWSEHAEYSKRLHRRQRSPATPVYRWTNVELKQLLLQHVIAVSKDRIGTSRNLIQQCNEIIAIDNNQPCHQTWIGQRNNKPELTLLWTNTSLAKNATRKA